MPIQELQAGKKTWLDLSRATDIDFRQLEERLPDLSLHDLADAQKTSQRPHLEERTRSLFLVLLFPVYNRATREIEPAEIDFFATDNALVTIHDGRLQPLLDCRNEAGQVGSAASRELAAGPRHLMVYALERLLNYCNPMLDHVSLDLRTIDQQIFKGNERTTVREILIARRNITDFRRIMQAHKNTLKKFLNLINKQPGPDTHALNLGVENLITRTKDIWDHLDSFKESIVDLHDTNQSLLSNNLNEIIKNYTTISVVIFSLTLVATTFGVGARGTPLLNHPAAFWLLAALLVLIALGMVEYFRRRKWL